MNKPTRIARILLFGLLASAAGPSALAVDFVEHSIPIAASGNQVRVNAADVDGDGDMDILSARNVNGGALWYDNDGNVPPAFTERLFATGVHFSEVAAEDLDGDGDLDLVTADFGSSLIEWHENDGGSPPTFTRRTVYVHSQARSVHAADVDGDGDMDVVSAATDGNIYWHENDGAVPPGFTAWLVPDTTGDFFTIQAVDIDGDGDTDLVSVAVAYSKVSWYENDGASPPVFTERFISSSQNPWWAAVADVDGDGDMDVLSISDPTDTVRWHENDGASPPAWTDHTISTNADAVRSVHAADVDGDGDTDVISASVSDDKAAWYENDGASPPGFTEHAISTSLESATSAHAEDFDGDGDIDVVGVGYGDPGLLIVYENTMAVAGVTPSLADPATGSTVAACVTIDITGHPDPLGSYGGTLSWDPAVLDYLGYTGGDAPFDSPVVNAASVGSGLLSFSDADAAGASGDVFVLCVDFDVIGASGTTSALDLELTSLFAVGTFEDLLTSATVNDATVDVVLECTVGDVNGDLAVNSGDALIILSDEILLPIPASAEERIAARCGDANGDGSTNSTDAGIVLSYEVGLDTSAFLVGGSNETLDDCTAWGGGAAPAAATASGPGSVQGNHPEGEAAVLTLSGSPKTNLVEPQQSRRGTIVSRLVAVPLRPRWGREIEVTVVVDATESGASLGSYGASLTWDPGTMRFLGAVGGNSPGFGSPVLNQAAVEEGTLRFAYASPQGAAGSVELVRVRFRALHRLFDPKRALGVTFSSMASSGPAFDNLLPLLEQETERRSGFRKLHLFERR